MIEYNVVFRVRGWSLLSCTHERESKMRRDSCSCLILWRKQRIYYCSHTHSRRTRPHEIIHHRLLTSHERVIVTSTLIGAMEELDCEKLSRTLFHSADWGNVGSAVVPIQLRNSICRTCAELSWVRWGNEDSNLCFYLSCRGTESIMDSHE